MNSKQHAAFPSLHFIKQIYINLGFTKKYQKEQETLYFKVLLKWLIKIGFQNPIE